jgi:hypothetical protein
MTSSFFYIEVRVPKLDIDCTNYFKSIDGFMSFQCQFIGLNENTTDHDYYDFKICPYKFWDGILMCRF